eukprot:3904030-Rhodomonas_salina.1
MLAAMKRVSLDSLVSQLCVNGECLDAVKLCRAQADANHHPPDGSPPPCFSVSFSTPLVSSRPGHQKEHGAALQVASLLWPCMFAMQCPSSMFAILQSAPCVVHLQAQHAFSVLHVRHATSALQSAPRDVRC